MISVATLGLSLNSSGMRAGLNDLKSVERAGNRAADALDNAGKRSKRATENLSDGFGALRAAVAALGLGAAIKQVVSINDEYARITGRLKLVTNGTAELAQVQESLFQVAQRTGSAYADTAELYTRVAQNAKDLGLSQQELINFTETTAQSFQVSGSSAEEAAGAIRQLTQGLAAGALRGDEFNSVAEAGPRIMQALADSLGVARGELREMAKDGKITAGIVIEAMRSQGQAISGEFSQLPITVGRAMTELENEVKRAIFGADISPLTDSIRELKELLSDPAIIQGIASIAGALINLAKVAAELAVTFAQVGINMGEFFASIAEGSRQTIPAVERQIRVLREMRERSGAGNAALSIIPGAVDIRFLAASNDELDAEIRRNQNLLDSLVGTTTRSAERLDEAQKRFAVAMGEYNRAMASGASPQVLAALGMAVDQARADMERFAPTVAAVGTAVEQAARKTAGATAELSKEQQAQIDKIKGMIQSMEEELILTKDLTKSEEVRISLANGYYGVVTAAQAEQLQGLADLITAREEDKKKTEEQIEAQKKLREQLAFTRAQQDFLDTQGRDYQRTLDDIGMGPAARRYSAGANQIEDQFLGQRRNLSDQLTRGDIGKGTYDQQLALLDSYQKQAITQWDSFYGY